MKSFLACIAALLLVNIPPALSESHSGTSGSDSNEYDSQPKGGTGLEVSSVNGKTTIRYNGKQVWKGKTKGKVVAQGISINGEAYAAAFDDDKLLWENREGAGEKVQEGYSGEGLPSLPDFKLPKEFKKFD